MNLLLFYVVYFKIDKLYLLYQNGIILFYNNITSYFFNFE
jgi:hypothetical protein